MHETELPGDAAPRNEDASEIFAGDQGNLPVETRRALVLLLQGPALDGRRHPRLWPVLQRDEAALRSRLHDLFLDLIIDHEQRVAFTRQIIAESIDAPILLRRATLTFIESALVLYLRRCLIQADARSERAVVSRTEMAEHLSVYERDGNVDHARFGRQMENAVEKTKKLSLLHAIRGSEDRFEISPTLKLLFPAEEIQSLTRIYRELAANTGSDAGAAAVPSPEDDTEDGA
jgi:hypothetical protein